MDPAETLQEQIEKFANMMNSTHKAVQLEGIIGIRKVLSSNTNPPIQEVIDSGIVPKILEMTTWEHEFKFQIEGSWCILNICATEVAKFSDYILDLGGLDIIMNLLDSPVNEIVCHAIWAIRNLAGTGSKYSDMCIEKERLKKFLQVPERFPNCLETKRIVIQAISDFCSRKPCPDWEKVLPVLPMLQEHISTIHSQDILQSALWCISCIARDNIQEVLDQDCLPHLVHHLCEGNEKVMFSSLIALGRLLAGKDSQSDEVLEYAEDFLPKLLELTESLKEKIQTNAFWVISNIAAGTSEQIEMITEDKDIIKRLKNAVATEPHDVAKEAAYAICNLINSANEYQVDQLVHQYGLMKCFTHILTRFDKDTKQEALEVILIVLESEARYSEKPHVNHVKEASLVEIITDLAKDNELSSIAEPILKYFSVENPEESDN